jgi:hypothetical protein
MVNNQVRRRGGSTTTAIWITLATKACAGVGINSRTNVCQKRCCLLVALALFALGLSCRAVPRRASGPRARPPGKAGETWVALPGGRFVSHARSSGETVGERAPRPDRVSRVLLTLSAFAMLRTEVTVGQYRACVEAGRCSKPKKTARDDERNNWGSARSDTHPINGVDWAQAKAFCAWIGGRLPTAAEWEYAARSAGKDQRYPWGDQRADCTRAVMHGAKGKGCGRHGTWPVCSKNAGNCDQRSRARASNSGLEVLVLDVEFESVVVAPRLGVLVDVEVKLGLWRTPCRCTARTLGRQAEVAQDLLRDGWIVDGAEDLHSASSPLIARRITSCTFIARSTAASL